MQKFWAYKISNQASQMILLRNMLKISKNQIPGSQQIRGKRGNSGGYSILSRIQMKLTIFYFLVEMVNFIIRFLNIHLNYFRLWSWDVDFQWNAYQNGRSCWRVYYRKSEIRQTRSVNYRILTILLKYKKTCF